MWVESPMIPPSAPDGAATSLFKGGFRANNVRPYGGIFLGRWGDVGIAPYEIPLSPTVKFPER